jgi:hypothetical protein
MSEHALRMALLAALGALGLYFAAVFIAGLREVGTKPGAFGRRSRSW